MGNSARLRLSDVQAVSRLIHECRELWADPDAWRQHLVVGATRLTGMAVAHFVEFSISGADGNGTAFFHADVGWRDTSAQRAYQIAAAAHPNAFKFFPGSERLLPQLQCGKQVAALRSEMCRQDEWYRSAVFNDFRRPACVDDNAMSAILRPDGVISFLDVSQDLADTQRPTGRTKRQLALLHRLISPLVGMDLATESHRCLYGLSPQLRVTLTRMLAGDTEKTIAVRLGLSRVTIHEYVGKIYRHFGVRLRGELMAYFIRRQPTPRCNA